MIQKKSLLVIFALVRCIVLCSDVHAGGWEWKLGSEGGYFWANEELNSEKIKYVGAFSGSVRYNYSHDKNSYLFQLRLRPEFYGPQGDNYTVNTSVTGQYQRRWGNSDFNAGVTLRKQKYQLHSNQLSINTFQLFTSTHWYFQKRMSAGMEGVYDNAVLSSKTTNTILSWSVTPKIFYSISSHGSMSAGVLIESYSVHTDDKLVTMRSNSGWRLGPKLNYEYSKNWFIRFDYLPSKRFSDKSNGSRMEHEINFVVGKNLTAHWSAFVLADYYVRASDSSAQNAVYMQSNYENRIHSKLVYSWGKSYSAYLKLAYTKNELINEKITLSGTQVSVGFEIQK